MKGIHANDNITNLSMTYCNLTKDCSRSIFELLIFSKSKIEKLNLAGNELRNEGVIQVMQGVSANKSLTEINLADN